MTIKNIRIKDTPNNGAIRKLQIEYLNKHKLIKMCHLHVYHNYYEEAKNEVQNLKHIFKVNLEKLTEF